MAKWAMTPIKLTYIASNMPKYSRHNGWLYVGSLDNSYYRSLLAFDLESVPTGVSVSRAALRIHSPKGCQSRDAAIVTPLTIDSAWNESVVWESQPLINQAVKGVPIRIRRGWNEIDMTQIVQFWADNPDKNFGVLLKSEEGSEDAVGFAVQSIESTPMLLLNTREKYHSEDGCLFDVYSASGRTEYTHWKETCDHSMYTFFVENIGNREVQAHVQLSPDRNTIVDETAQYIILPGKTEAIVTQKFAYFTRLAFSTASPGSHSSIRVWFQPLLQR